MQGKSLGCIKSRGDTYATGSHRRGMKEPRVADPCLRTSVPACCCHNGCIQYGLGCYMQWAGSLVALDGASTALAHTLPRAVGSASSLAAVQATAVSQACVGPYGQHCGCLVHQPIGSSTITPHVTARPPSLPLESHAAQMQPMRFHDSSHSPENDDSTRD